MTSSVAVPHQDDPDWEMKDAFRALKDGHCSDDEHKKRLLAALLAGKNAVWAWFALSSLYLNEEVKDRLCQIVAKGGDGLVMWWTLSDVSDLTARARRMLVDGIVKTRLPYLAENLLNQAADLTDQDRFRLSRIMQGLNPFQEV